jgi:hypothetical protein
MYVGRTVGKRLRISGTVKPRFPTECLSRARPKVKPELTFTMSRPSCKLRRADSFDAAIRLVDAFAIMSGGLDLKCMR